MTNLIPKYRSFTSIGHHFQSGFHSELWFILIRTMLLTSLVQSIIIDDAHEEEELLAKFPGLFKSEEELGVIEDKSWPDLEKMSISFGKEVPDHEDAGKGATKIFHGCCESVPSFKAYEELKDKEGVLVKLIEFQKRKQYVQTETCRQLPDCGFPCSCAKEDRLFTALILNPKWPDQSNEKVILDFVAAPTVCRCFNNLAAPGRRDEL